MFAGSILDAATTWVIVSRNIGFETNPNLALLIRHSLIWIPIYLLLGPLLVPLFPELCRFAFSVYFALAGLAFGTNNLAGIFYGRYFLIGAIGFPVLQGICIFFGVAVFIWRTWKRVGSAGDWWRDVISGLCFLGFFMLLELGFFATGRLLALG